jgi:hypothetical protein
LHGVVGAQSGVGIEEASEIVAVMDIVLTARDEVGVMVISDGGKTRLAVVAGVAPSGLGVAAGIVLVSRKA